MKHTPMTREEKLEQLLTAFCGGLDREERADLEMMEITKNQIRKDKAVSRAKKLLRNANHPVTRKDMLSAMDAFILICVDHFTKDVNKDSAIMLLSAVICKNILTDGPLHEGE